MDQETGEDLSDGQRHARRERMREESEALAQDPEYRAEIRRVQEDVEPYRTW